jgi:hypothetical protein
MNLRLLLPLVLAGCANLHPAEDTPATTPTTNVVIPAASMTCDASTIGQIRREGERTFVCRN